MAGIEEVLKRLGTDPSFEQHLMDDPKRALADYDLSASELDQLAHAVAARDERGTEGARPSSAARVALFSQLLGDRRGGADA